MIVYQTLNKFRQSLEYDLVSLAELERRLQLCYPHYIEDLFDEEPDEPTRSHFQEVLRVLRADRERAQALLNNPVALLDLYICELESFAHNAIAESHDDMDMIEHDGSSTQREQEELTHYLATLYAEIAQHREGLATLKRGAV